MKILYFLYFMNKEEAIGMWSGTLRILDENSLKYYVEELKEELDKEKLFYFKKKQFAQKLS